MAGPGPPPPGWWWGPPPPRENNLATVGLVCAICGAGGLIVTFGFFMFFTLPASIAGIVLGVVGKQKADRGEVMGGRGVAQAALIVGIIGVVLHLLAIVLFLLFGFLLLAAIDEIDSTPNENLEPAFRHGLALLLR